MLSTFTKIFEVLLWSHLENWWGESNAVCETQSACRKCISSLHTALLLQDTILADLENGKQVLVAYLDVSNAFDSVLVEGLSIR